MIGFIICILAALINVPSMQHGSVINYIAFVICVGCGLGCLVMEIK